MCEDCNECAGECEGNCCSPEAKCANTKGAYTDPQKGVTNPAPGRNDNKRDWGFEDKSNGKGYRCAMAMLLRRSRPFFLLSLPLPFSPLNFFLGAAGAR